MSNTIVESNYNKATKTLSLVFGYDTEKVYNYANFPATKWNQFEKAESKGKFFHAVIRGKFETTSEYR